MPRAPNPSLALLISDLWSEAIRQSGYQEVLWQELVALAPALEVRGPSSSVIDVQLVQDAMEMTAQQRWGRLRILVRSLRAAAELDRNYHAASWRTLELQLGLLGPIKGMVVEPTKKQLAIAELRQRADAVLTAISTKQIADDDAAHRLRVIVAEAHRWRAGGAWLRFHLAGVLERCGEIDEAYRNALLARDADPMDLRYHLLCRTLGTAVIARDAGFTSGERGQT